jgi:ankyrin repeat protein
MQIAILATLLSCALAQRGYSLDDHRLADAVMRKDQTTAQALLKQRPKVNARQSDGSTALAWAAHWNDLATADALLKAGADPNLANDYGVTPLALACVNGNLDMVQKLVAAKANPNALAQTGETPFLNCVRTGNVDAVKLMMEARADVNLAEKWRGQTPLMWAVAEKHPEVTKALVDHGADVNAKSKGGFTALQFAAQQGDLDSAKILVAAGANVNEADPEDGMTALLTAIGSNQPQLASFLVERGQRRRDARAGSGGRRPEAHHQRPHHGRDGGCRRRPLRAA